MSVNRLSYEQRSKLEDIIRPRARATDKANCKHSSTIVEFVCDDGLILSSPGEASQYINNNNFLPFKITRSHIESLYAYLNLSRKLEQQLPAATRAPLPSSPDITQEFLYDLFNNSALAKGISVIAQIAADCISSIREKTPQIITQPASPAVTRPASARPARTEEQMFEIIKAGFLKYAKNKEWLSSIPHQTLVDVAREFASKFAKNEKLSQKNINWNVSIGRKQALLLMAYNLVSNN